MEDYQENEKGSAPAGTGTKPEAPNLAGDDTDNVSDSLTFDKLAGRQFSLFRDAFTTEPGGVLHLGELLDGIRSGRWEQEVMQVRSILQKDGKEAYDKAKRHLPAVTLSGTVEGVRKDSSAENRLHHSGFLQIDVDAKDHPSETTGELRDRCMSSPHVVAVWLSPSGQGIKAVVPVVGSPDLHLNSFLAADRHFQGLGLKIDAATKDAARLMFVSHDPDLWVCSGPVEVMVPLDDPAGTGEDGSEPEHDDSNTQGEVSDQRIRNILSYIPKRPPYDDWIRIAWAVFSCLPEEAAIRILNEWSPEEKLGEYARLKRESTVSKKVKLGTLLHYARMNGYKYKREIIVPPDVLPLPTGGIGIHRSASIIFQHLGSTGKVFMRGSSVCEIVERNGQEPSIEKVSPERFMELVETVGKRVAGHEVITKKPPFKSTDVKRIVWRTKVMPHTVAKVLLETDAARIDLPQLRQIVNSPLIVEKPDGKCEILRKGYHDFNGGTFVRSNVDLELIPGGLITAVNLVKRLLGDFDFATQADFSRAVASLLSPALKMSGLINGDFPLDVAEADRSQSGKTFRQQMVCALYSEVPTVITGRKGGVGGLDESVANAMLAGRPFISIDNLRGPIESQLLETALRGHGFATCRGFRASETIDVSPFIWQLSTNGAEFTRDLANRSVITRIRKRPDGYLFRQHSEGNVLAHLKNRRSLYLSAVFDIIREWIASGKPQTAEARHDFREWSRSLDWIVQNLFHLPPLMDGHRAEQVRTASPNLQWLRDVLLAAEPHHFDRNLTTAALVGIAEDNGIDFPPSGSNREKPTVRAGKILKGVFARNGGCEVMIDGFLVSRVKMNSSGLAESRSQTLYTIRRAGNET